MESKDWITVLFVVAIVLIAVSKFLYESRFEHFKSLMFSNKYILLYGKDKNLVLHRFNMLLFLVQIISLSIFLYLFIETFIPSLQNDSFLFLKIVSALLLVISFKYFLEKIIGSTLDIESTIEHYNFEKISYRNLISIGLLPIYIIIVYVSFKTTAIMYFTVACFIILHVISQFLIFKNNQKLIFGSLFYFILYLCALEISPYLIIYKLFIIL